MMRTRLIGIFGGLVLTSAMAACGSSGDDSGSNAGASGHAGASGKGGGTSKAGNAGTGGNNAAGVGNDTGNAGEAGSAGMAGGAGETGVVVVSTKFTIHAENVSATSALPTAISPGVAVLHTTANPFFTQDAVDRGQGLGALASDADPTALFAAVKTATGIDGASLFNIPTGATAAAPLQPGDAYDFVVDAVPGDKLSIVSMFGESNDAFFAPTGAGIALFDDNGAPIAAHDVTDQISLWDAGVEKDEAPGLGPTQKPRQLANGAGSAEGVASKRLDTTRALPLAEGIVSFTVTQVAGVFTIAAKNISVLSGAIYTPLSPFYVATHAATFKLFTAGAAAPAGLESLAEDGNPTALVTATSGTAGVGSASAQGAALLAPGDTLTFVVTPSVSAPRLSFASMISQTNDVFLATPPEGIALLDDAGAPRAVADVQDELNRLVANWDAGTEANQVPGAGADIGSKEATANQGAADTNNKVRRYSDSTNDLDGANLGGFASVVITQGSAGAFNVTVSNTSSGAFIGNLSPVAWAVHDATTQLFTVGKSVSAGLQSLAEDGVGATLATELAANTHVLSKGVQGLTPIATGANFLFSVTPDMAHPNLSIVSMIAPSNDTFLALGESGVALLDATGTPRSDTAIATDVAALLAAYDAGTEANQAGAAGPSMAGTTLAGIPLQAAVNTGAADGNGLVRLLVSPVWTYPTVKSVIKVTITPQ
jgi:hypothetical protein